MGKKKTKYINKIIKCKNGYVIYNAFEERIDAFKGYNTEFEHLKDEDVIDIFKRMKTLL